MCACTKMLLYSLFSKVSKKKNTFIFKATKYVEDDVSPVDNVSMSSYIITAHHLC